MKDFKKMPKMACGGGVKKYATGGDILADYKKAVKEGTLEKPSLLEVKPKSKTINVDGTDVNYNNRAVPMPSPKASTDFNVVGEARTPRSEMKGLKTGGKVKRGSKKK